MATSTLTQLLNYEEAVPLVVFMYLVFTHMLGESYRRQFRSLLLCSCDVFPAIINYFCWLRHTFLDYRFPDSYLSLSCRIVGYIILGSQYGL